MKRLNDLLRVADFEGTAYRQFGRLLFGDSKYWLSVQATYGHYCRPRKTLPVEEYESFEVMANMHIDDLPGKWDEYGNIYDVFSCVPREEIEEFIAVLEKKYGEVRSE